MLLDSFLHDIFVRIYNLNALNILEIYQLEGKHTFVQNIMQWKSYFSPLIHAPFPLKIRPVGHEHATILFPLFDTSIEHSRSPVQGFLNWQRFWQVCPMQERGRGQSLSIRHSGSDGEYAIDKNWFNYKIFKENATKLTSFTKCVSISFEGRIAFTSLLVNFWIAGGSLSTGVC